MAWNVEYTDEFGQWWQSLNESEQIDVDAVIGLLEQRGPLLARPFADTVQTSQHHNMKELRIQHDGRLYRVLFAFDPGRSAILLIGGDKTGNDRWYEQFVPIADRLFTQHLKKLRKEN